MFFDYFDGYLRVAFSRGSYGDLNMDLVLHGDATAMFPCYGLGETGRTQISTPEDVSLRTWICASACPFRQFIAWLEAVTCGVQAFVESDHYDPQDYESPSVSNLRELRSALVEGWLARQQQAAARLTEGTT